MGISEAHINFTEQGGNAGRFAVTTHTHTHTHTHSASTDTAVEKTVSVGTIIEQASVLRAVLKQEEESEWRSAGGELLQTDRSV